MYKKFILIVALWVFTSPAFSQAEQAPFTIKARLVKAEQLPVSCGVLAVALTQKFQVTETDLPFLKPGMFVLLNMPCPESAGAGYFVTNEAYQISAAFMNRSHSSFLIMNIYKSDDLPMYWIDDICKLTN
jgi:hypothetical protein